LSRRAISLAAAAAVALALATIAVLLVLASDHEDNKAATIALAVTAGVSFIASGLVALWRRPDNHTGYLLAAVGYLWFFGALTESNNDWVFTIGLALNSLVFGAFIHLLLAFPGGRLTRRRDLWLVVSTYVLVFAGNMVTLLLDEVPDPKSCPDCRSTIAVGSNDDLESVLAVIVTALALAILVTVLVVVVRRYLRSQGALRRALGPVLGAGALAMLVLALQVVIDTFSQGSGQPLEYIFPRPSPWSRSRSSSASCAAGWPGPASVTSCSRSGGERRSAKRSPAPSPIRRSRSRTGCRTRSATSPQTESRCPRSRRDGR
jgi:hypothetical protein